MNTTYYRKWFWDNADLLGKERKYKIYIKSHSELPDYENECIAMNLWDAANKFIKGLPDWNREDLVQFIKVITVN